MSQGFRLGAFMMALVLASFTLGSMGWYAHAGVSFETGHRGDVDTINEDLVNPDAPGTGTERPGFFGVATGLTRLLEGVYLLVGGVSDIAISWGAPWPIAYSMQAMFDFAFGLSLLAFWRGVTSLL